MVSITLSNAEVSAILTRRRVKANNGGPVRMGQVISFAGQRMVRAYFPGARLTFDTGKVMFHFDNDEDAVLYRMKELSL